MTGNVVDLLARREARREAVLHFDTAVEALDFAATQIRELQDHAETALLLPAENLALPLAQAAAVILECRRLCEAYPTPNGEAR
jgi:hypothetical protein